MATLPELLQTLVENNGSDLHITTDTPPQIRVHGHMKPLDLPPLGPSDTKALAYSVLTDQQKKRFEEALELDFSFGIRGIARFRCNVFNQRGAVAAVYRVIPKKGKGCDRCNNSGYKGRVGLYEVMEITEELRELILVGASGLELRRKAVEEGMITLRGSGLLKVKLGVTTIEEVVRETVK